LAKELTKTDILSKWWKCPIVEEWSRILYYRPKAERPYGLYSFYTDAITFYSEDYFKNLESSDDPTI